MLALNPLNRIVVDAQDGIMSDKTIKEYVGLEHREDPWQNSLISTTEMASERSWVASM